MLAGDLGTSVTRPSTPRMMSRARHMVASIGRFVELVPYRRLVFTYVEVDLVERDGATTGRLVHRGLPPERV